MSSQAPKRARLSRRDSILLPLCSLVAIALTLGPVELISRMKFAESKSKSLSCMDLNDLESGPHAIPNSTCSYKIPESNRVEYRFNSCGHRAGMECGPKPADTFRIVLVGTSMAEGLHVPWNQTFAAMLPKELSRETGHKVELYNEALEWESPHRIDLRFKDDVLAAQPDLILWAVTKWDVENAGLTTASPKFRREEGEDKSGISRAWHRTIGLFRDKTLQQGLADNVKHGFEIFCPGTVFLMEHLLYESRTEYVQRYVSSDQETDFLRSRPDPAWQMHLQTFDYYVSDIMARAKMAGVPVYVVVLPPRIEATLISMGEWPAALDPYKFGQEVRSSVESHGGKYLDLLQGFRRIGNAEQYYYAVDGHPNAGGQAIFGSLLSKAFTSDAVSFSEPARDKRTTALRVSGHRYSFSTRHLDHKKGRKDRLRRARI